MAEVGGVSRGVCCFSLLGILIACGLPLVVNLTNTWSEDDVPNLTGQFALITGANAGLGYETARIMAEKGCDVMLACRSETKCQAAAARLRKGLREKMAATDEHMKLASVSTVTVDLSEPESISKMADVVKTQVGRIDYLINNAGVLPSKKTVNSRGWETAFAVNHLGHYLLVAALLSLLKSSKTRIVNHSSMASHLIQAIDLEDPFFDLKPFQGFRGAYAQSKRANLLFTHSLNQKFGDSGITATACHPGEAGTKMGTQDSPAAIEAILGIPGVAQLLSKIFAFFAKSPRDGALPQVYAAVIAEKGEYIGPAFADFGPLVDLGPCLDVSYHPGNWLLQYVGLAPPADSPEDAEALWRKSAAITGVAF